MRIVFRCDPTIENELIRLVAARKSAPAWTTPGDIAIVS
jgi:hypothetical protein